MSHSPRPLTDIVFSAELDNISTASTTYTVAPSRGEIVSIQGVIHGTIATSAPTLTPSIAGTAITNGTMQFENSGSAAGDIVIATPSGANFCTENALISVATDGVSTNAVRATINFILRKWTG